MYVYRKGDLARDGLRRLYTVGMMREARQRRFVRVLALIVLLGAILPSITYVGHWTVRGLEAVNVEAGDDGHANHANHCHGSSACSDQAAYGLQWWAQDAEALVLDGGPQRALDPERTPSPVDPVVVPLDPPPQHV